jgi:hypothetical protein
MPLKAGIRDNVRSSVRTVATDDKELVDAIGLQKADNYVNIETPS